MFGIGNAELLVLALVALLLFGDRLPAVMRDLGKTFSGLKRNMEKTREDVRNRLDESDKK